MHKGALIMKFQYLLIGTSLTLIPQTINAQCVATQDCATLGYTETSCSGNSGIKCPFGNFWACFKSESEYEQEFCTKYGFTQTCTETGYIGVGKACNGKYTSCTCTSDYIWNDSSQKCESRYANCTVGAFYYADGTCSNDYLTSEKLLGVVIYEKTASENGWIMTVKPVKTGIEWAEKREGVPGLGYFGSTPTDIQASCTNTDIITAYGNSSKYPAAWAARNYRPSGTPSNKSWCLPSGGLLNNINNSTNFAKINAAITTAGGTKLGYIAKAMGSYHEYMWSSSHYTSDRAWLFSAESSGSFGLSYYNKNFTYTSDFDIPCFSVRPVLAF